jgi:hypothetical protein
MTTKQMYILIGDTYAKRESLKAAGWRWDGGNRRWTRHCATVEGAGLDVAKQIGAWKNGCKLMCSQDGGCFTTVWCSKNYVEAVRDVQSFAPHGCPECGSCRPNPDCCVCGGR